MNSSRPIAYTVQKRHFLVELSRSSLRITIEDFEGRRRYLSEVTNRMLLQPLDVFKLFQQVFKQFIFDNKIATRMLRCEGREIVLKLDFPCCQLKELRFPCAEFSTDDGELKLEIVRRLFEESRERMLALSEQCLSRMDLRASQKMEEISQAMDLKLERLAARLDALTEVKAEELGEVYNKHEREHSGRLREELERSVRQIVTDNGRLLKEFHFMKNEIESSIEGLARNIEVIHEGLAELGLEVQENSERAQQQLAQACREIQDSIGRKINELEEWKEKREKKE